MDDDTPLPFDLPAAARKKVTAARHDHSRPRRASVAVRLAAGTAANKSG